MSKQVSKDLLRKKKTAPFEAEPTTKQGSGGNSELVISAIEQVTYEIRFNLATLFLPLYCSMFLVGLFIVSRYQIDRDGHSSNLERLSERLIPNPLY